jgi:cell division transport system permease protein
MLWVNIKRIIRSGAMNFFRNGFVSLSAVLIMTVTLFVIGSVVFMLAGLNASLSEVKNKVDISVYFNTGASESDVLAVKKSLEALPGIVQVEYITKEQALDRFKKRHEGDELTLQALEELGSNPLGAILNVKAKDPSQYQSIANFLKKESSVSGPDEHSPIDLVDYFNNQVVIEKLTKIITAAERLGFAVSIILIIISLIIAFNTIRLIIFISRDEISVMRLVGASYKYIRWPFVISGILYGFVAGLLTIAVFYPLTRWVGSSTANFLGGINLFSYYTNNFGQLFAIIVGSGIVLGACSSYLAVRRYLKP